MASMKLGHAAATTLPPLLSQCETINVRYWQLLYKRSVWRIYCNVRRSTICKWRIVQLAAITQARRTKQRRQRWAIIGASARTNLQWRTTTKTIWRYAAFPSSTFERTKFPQPISTRSRQPTFRICLLRSLFAGRAWGAIRGKTGRRQNRCSNSKSILRKNNPWHLKEICENLAEKTSKKSAYLLLANDAAGRQSTQNAWLHDKLKKFVASSEKHTSPRAVLQ